MDQYCDNPVIYGCIISYSCGTTFSVSLLFLSSVMCPLCPVSMSGCFYFEVRPFCSGFWPISRPLLYILPASPWVAVERVRESSILVLFVLFVICQALNAKRHEEKETLTDGLRLLIFISRVQTFLYH